MKKLSEEGTSSGGTHSVANGEPGKKPTNSAQRILEENSRNLSTSLNSRCTIVFHTLPSDLFE